MRILIISHHFWPENFKINDLVDNFINKGYEVSILTGKPNYPGGKIFKSFKFKSNSLTNFLILIPAR